MIKLYDFKLSGNCYKVRLALNQLGVEFTREFVDIFAGEHKLDWFIAENPNAKLPVLVDNGFTIWESNAILLYLGNKFAPNRLYPDDTETYGRVCQWLFFGKTTLDPNLAMARYLTRFVPEDKADHKQLSTYKENSARALEILDNYLRENKFLAGSYSIADIGCYPYVHTAGEGNISLTPYPSVLEWCQRIESEPGYISMDW